MATRVFMNAAGKIYSGSVATSPNDSELTSFDSDYVAAAVTTTPTHPDVIAASSAFATAQQTKLKGLPPGSARAGSLR